MLNAQRTYQGHSVLLERRHVTLSWYVLKLLTSLSWHSLFIQLKLYNIPGMISSKDQALEKNIASIPFDTLAISDAIVFFKSSYLYLSVYTHPSCLSDRALFPMQLMQLLDVIDCFVSHSIIKSYWVLFLAFWDDLIEFTVVTMTTDGYALKWIARFCEISNVEHLQERWRDEEN